MRDSLGNSSFQWPHREPISNNFRRPIRFCQTLFFWAKFYYFLTKLYFHDIISFLRRTRPELFEFFVQILTFLPSNKVKMDSIIHQASPTNQNQAELTPLTQPNDGPTGKSGQGRPGRNRGGFLRSLLCCFTGGAEPITEPVLPQDPIAISQPQDDEKGPTEAEPCQEQYLNLQIVSQ